MGMGVLISLLSVDSLSILTIGSFRQYAYTAFNFALLLFAQVGIAYGLPVKTPDHWRAYDLTATPSRYFL